jgi:cation diffusion facilitator family transporter
MRENIENLREFKKLIDVAFFSVIPFLIIYIVIGILSNSIAISVIALDYGLSLIVQIFFFSSIRTILKSNVLRFSYGTGKIENFSGFLYGALAIPTSIFFIYSAVTRFVHTPAFISFGVALIPLIPSLARSVLLFIWSGRLLKRTDSPMVKAYFINFKVCTMFDIGVLAALTAALIMVHSGSGRTTHLIAYSIDSSLSLLIALYMLFYGIKLTVENFKVLTDFPLSEEDQLKILSVLAREYDHFENIGEIYTRRSGSKRFIEIELHLKEDASLAEMVELKERVESALREDFPDLQFSLIPLI